jgi:multidrug efflux pump
VAPLAASGCASRWPWPLGAALTAAPWPGACATSPGAAGLLAVIGLNVHLYQTIDKGFMPSRTRARHGLHPCRPVHVLPGHGAPHQAFLAIVQPDPAVEYVTGFTGGGRRNAANMFMSLKPMAERKVSSDEVINRLREKLKNEPGARLFMMPSSDVRIGGRQSMASYEYTLQADDTAELRPGSRASARCCPPCRS